MLELRTYSFEQDQGRTIAKYGILLVTRRNNFPSDHMDLTCSYGSKPHHSAMMRRTYMEERICFFTYYWKILFTKGESLVMAAFNLYSVCGIKFVKLN